MTGDMAGEVSGRGLSRDDMGEVRLGYPEQDRGFG